MSGRSQAFECSVKRIVPGQATPIPGTFRIQGSQLQWAPQNSADGQSFKVALEAITGAMANIWDTTDLSPSYMYLAAEHWPVLLLCTQCSSYTRGKCGDQTAIAQPDFPASAREWDGYCHHVNRWWCVRGSGTLQKAKAKPQMRVATVSGPLMLEFGSMEERDAVIARITPLLVRSLGQGSGSNIEPTGPLAAEKKQLLEEDKCAPP